MLVGFVNDVVCMLNVVFENNNCGFGYLSGMWFDIWWF